MPGGSSTHSYVGATAVEAPDNWAPGRLAESLVLFRDDKRAVIVDGFAVYPTGFAFSSTLITRDPAQGYERHALHDPRGRNLTVRYADGALSSGPPAEANVRVRLLPRGGSGGPTVWRQDWWCAPLPPPGPVQFDATFLTDEDAISTIEGALLLEAANRAVQLWPDRVVEPPVIDAHGAPALPPPGRQPVDPNAARQAIRTAFLVALDHTEPSADPLAAIQDGPALAGAKEQARANHPGPAGTIRVALGDIVFIDEVRAAVVFQLNWSGAMTFGPQLGYAVLEGGDWKVARDTYCRVLGWAGVSCPPPPPPQPSS